MEIIQAGLSQIELIAPLFDLYRQFYNQPSDPERSREFLRERLAKGESVIFLAVLRGSPVGFVQLYPSFASASMQRVWILNDLFVAAAARRNGVGRALIERSRQLAIATSAKGLALSTGIENLTAQRLYEDIGFRKDAEFYRYFLTT